MSSDNGQCNACGTPLDAEYFDDSRILEGDLLPHRPGEHAVLASFQLHPQYCGLLTWFCQFTDLFALDNSRIKTTGLKWAIVRNGQPLYPYHDIDKIVNPWGYGGLEVAIRLDQSARVEFQLRNQDYDFDDPDAIKKVAGRILGRYWYDPAYGTRRAPGRPSGRPPAMEV